MKRKRARQRSAARGAQGLRARTARSDTLIATRHDTAPSPIRGLPPELLVNIFLCLASVFPPNYDMITVCLVCHFWRAVALENSSLWTSISFENLAHARMYLRNSRSLPIRVYIHIDWICRDGDPAPITVMLNAHCDRIQTMHAAIGCRHTLFNFLRPLCKAAPILEKLVLHAGTVRNRWSSTWGLDDLVNTGEVLNYLYPTHPPFEGHTPLLHTLVLSHLYFSYTSGIYRNLVNLTIIHLHPTEALEPFFRVLSSSPALEKLTLVMRSPDYEVRFLQPPQLPHVHLPRLRFLGITCDVTPLIAAILAHLSFPMGSRIYLSSRMDRDRTRWSALSAVLRDPRCSPAPHMLHLELHNMANKYLLVCMYPNLTSMGTRLSSFRLAVSVPDMGNSAVSVLSVLDVSRIETFAVFGFVAAEGYYFWRPVLQPMHRLRGLFLQRVPSATLIAVLRTLQWYTYPIGKPGAPYCTHLQYLVLGGVEKDVAAELVDFLKFCVANRKVLAQVRVMELRGWDADMVNHLNGHGNIRVVYMPPTG